jgi:hypothetical protein
VWPARFVLVLGTMIASFSYLLMFIEDGMRAIRGQAPAHTSATH